MKLWLAWGFRIGRPHGSAPLANRQLAGFTQYSDANRRLFSSFSGAWLSSAAPGRRTKPGANATAEPCTVGGRLLLKLSYKPQLESWRVFCSRRHRGGADPSRKLDVHERVTAWLQAEGPKGMRNKDIRNRSGALVKPSQDKKSVLSVGPADAKLAAKGTTGKESVEVSAETWQLFVEYDVLGTLEGMYGVRFRATELASKKVQLTVHGRNADKVAGMFDDPPRKLDVHERVSAWLLAVGPNGIRVRDIRKRLGVLVCPTADRKSVLLVGLSKATLTAKRIIEGLQIRHARVPGAKCYWLTNKAEGAEFARSKELNRKYNTSISLGPFNDADPARMVELTVVGELEEDVDNVLAIIDELHMMHSRIPAPVRFWLTNKVEGADCARGMYLERKFDACITLGQPDDDDPACMVDLAVVGERKENVDQVLAEIGKTQHIKLKCERVSLAIGNYVARKRPDLENDDRQIHLRHDPLTYSSTCEMRCLHRVGSEGDDPGPAHQKLMQELDIHEVVLDMHKSWAKLLVEQSRQIEADEVIGMGVSTTVSGRALVIIAGSRITVKRGRDKVIELITSDRRYRPGDICLRRIEGQSVDTQGFEKAAPVRKEDLSSCKDRFLWERLTHEQWRYTGRASSNRKRSQSTSRRKHKAAGERMNEH